jgi:hypothetical protein
MAADQTRVALYVRARSEGEDEAELSSDAQLLREYATTQGWDPCEEYIDRGAATGNAAWQRLLHDLSRRPQRVDVVLVKSLIETFPSTEALVSALQSLRAMGIDLLSYDQPWLSGAATARTATTGPLVSDDLQRALITYLDRSTVALERDAKAQAETARRARMLAQVGQMVGYLVVLLIYVVIITVANSSVLYHALLDPHELQRNVQDAAAFFALLPAILVSSLGLLLIFAFRSGSLRAQADVGGIAFVGAVVLALLGLSAAASAGAFGSLEAVPGFIGAFFVMDAFTGWLMSVRAAAAVRKAPSRGLATRFEAVSTAKLKLRQAVTGAHPPPGRGAAAAFVLLPVVTVLVIIAGVAVVGARNDSPPPWLFVLTAASLMGLGAWAVWAFWVTPPTVRIPLWSMVAWAVFFQTLFRFGAASAAFALTVTALLIFNVIVAALTVPTARSKLMAGRPTTSRAARVDAIVTEPRPDPGPVQ